MTVKDIIRECEILESSIVYNKENVNSVTQWFTDVTGINWNGQPWCAMTISYIFEQAQKGQNIVPMSAVCSGIVKYMAQIDISNIKQGDIVIFDFNGDNENDHIGIVYDTTDKSIATYDGNNSNDRFTLSVRNKKYVSKAYRPNYDDFIKSNIDFDVLRYGSKGKEVSLLQAILNKLGYNLNIDGDYGTQTNKAVTDFQQNTNIEADGVVGAVTWQTLITSIYNLI